MTEREYRIYQALGLPTSSRHMNRIQAEHVIRTNMQSTCLFFREQYGAEYVNNFFVNLIQVVGHNPWVQVVDDNNYSKHLKLFGAMYWYRCFIQCEMEGKESIPLVDTILPVSVIKPEEFIIVADEFFTYNTLDEDTKNNNRILMDELDKSHNLIGLLVDGYLWAQGHERQVEKKYRRNHDDACRYLYRKARGEFNITEDDVEQFGEIVSDQTV